MSTVNSSEQTKPTRRQRAHATRRRIVNAAYSLFCEHGYTATTMDQIAQSAGVAVQTVYFVFHTKGALLSRTYEFAVGGGGDEPVIPQQQPWYAAMVAEPDITQALRHLVTGVGEIMRRVTPLYLVVRIAADSDPDAAQIIASSRDLRAAGYREVVELLRAKTGFRPGLTVERATHLLLLFVGMDAYHTLVATHGWTHEEWVDWTVSVVAEQIFGRTAP
ncbi:MAG TPA: TetR/AcrR family transcriptional regulator [Acidimicrobiia bacterium]|nr:TetR/AcrR family transcriptional regulator [Acidimicrobiia bacterium]